MTTERFLDLIFPSPVGVINTDQQDLCSHCGQLVLNQMTDHDKEFLKNHREWTTNDTLHIDPNFKKLRNLIDSEVERFCKDIMGINSNTDLTMTGMWANVRLGGSRHHMHLHPNSFISGVIYLSAPVEDGDDPGSILFADPRPAKMFNADFKTDGPLSYRSWWYTPALGKLLIFPSWLEHGTHDGNFDNSKRRISLSFNYALLQCSKVTMPLNLRPA